MLKIFSTFCIATSLIAMFDDIAWFKIGEQEFQNNILRERSTSLDKQIAKVVYIDPKIVLIGCKIIDDRYKVTYLFGHNTLPSTIKLSEGFQKRAQEVFVRLESKFYSNN